MESQSSVTVEGGRCGWGWGTSYGHLLLVCEEKAFCQLGAPSPPMGVTAHSPGYTKPLGPEKVAP